jgi:hypothetical protein
MAQWCGSPARQGHLPASRKNLRSHVSSGVGEPFGDSASRTLAPEEVIHGSGVPISGMEGRASFFSEL